jgi:uncharacterized protein YlxW (UPF0749 family)
MNTVGKMLVVLQLCLSLLFVCFAGATYSLQGDWKKRADRAEEKIKSLKNDLDAALAEKNREVAEAQKAVVEANNVRDTVTAALRTAEQERDTANGIHDETRKERDKAIATTEQATAEATARRTETIGLRAETASLQDRLVEYLRVVREKDNRILDQNTQLNDYQQSEERLIAKLADRTALLRSEGIDPDKYIAVSVSAPVDKIDGIVTGRKQSRSRTQEFVELSIGSDDKIRMDMILLVYREGEYVCDVRISVVNPDTSIGIVIPSTRRSNTMRGDRVTTKF